MSFPALADNLFQAAWTVACVTLLHTAVYRVAHKDLRAWIAVNEYLVRYGPEHAVADDQAERVGARHAVQVGGVQEVTTGRNRSNITKHMRKCVVPVSLAAPILLSIVLQAESLGQGYLDPTLIVTEYILLTFAITNVLTLSKPEIAIVSTRMTKQNFRGWAVVDSRGKISNMKALDLDTARNFVPAISLVLCFAVVLANQVPHSAAHAVLLIALTMLGPLCLLRTSRGDNMKMKGWLIFMGSASGAFTVLVLVLLSPTTVAPRSPNLPEEGTDWFNRVWKNKLSIMGNDLIRAIFYALHGFLFCQMVALLRFDYAQMRNNSSGECENAASIIPRLKERVVDAGHATEARPILQLSTPRESPSGLVHISRQTPAFSAPTFKGSIIGSYLATIIAVLLFPTPELCILWLPATLVGQSLGGALSVSWNRQWKALWKYEEVWKVSDTVEC